MKSFVHARSIAALLVTFCLLLTPVAALAKKGEKNFKLGLQHEAAERWDKAAQEFALAIAADPKDAQYQLHYRRSLFNASQMFMVQGRAFAEQRDYIGAYNAFRQAFGYDPVNQLAQSEMERMLRLQTEKEAARDSGGGEEGGSNSSGMKVSPTSYQQDGQAPTSPGTPRERRTTSTQEQETIPTGTEQLRVINYSGDLKAFIRSLAEQLSLNVVFDTTTFRTPKNVDINLRNVTTAMALDMLFLQEGLFFQKLNRRTILVADQTRRPQFQQLVLRTFYLSNADPTEAVRLIQQAIPAQSGRPPTIVIPDKATNSLTIRDTAENVQLIGELLSSIDKDRAEVVMDVSIYEVSRNDLMQFGNQLGSFLSAPSLGGVQNGAVAYLNGVRDGSVAGSVASLPTALSAALILPSSTISAFQRKSNTKLLASTQIHAFTGEESTARIGERVPVQTAQTYPFSTVTTDGKTPTGGGAFPGGGFPVINYEPTGLTLKFTPQVFPNLDVQVKMSIESKDVLDPSLTPTFIERTITGTARIQNNRTMMLVSLAQDKESKGRAGLPILGSLPILGRLFTAPTRDNRKTDIVIAVTPRVLRAPTVTPDDERARPSGTLQTPTTGSLEAMIEEADREDQLAAARRLPKDAVVVVDSKVDEPPPQATAKDVGLKETPTKEIETESPAYVPAPKELMMNEASVVPSGGNSQPLTDAAIKTNATSTPELQASDNAPIPVSTSNVPAKDSKIKPGVTSKAANVPRASKAMTAMLKTAVVQQPAASFVAVSAQSPVIIPVEEPPHLPALVASVKTETVFKPIAAPNASPAELRLIPERNEMRVGDKRRLALVLKTDAPLGLAVITMRFDPRTVAVRHVTTGNLFAGQMETPPNITQSVNQGVLLVSIAPPTGATMTGAGVLVFIDIEALAVGESVINFDKNNMHLIASDGRAITMQLVQSEVVVKQ